MKRFLNTLRWDIQLQFRNGFYYVSAFVAVLIIILLRQVRGDVDWSLWWPPVLLENLVINSFFLMAGFVLLEKGEGTLEAQIVTPLRTHDHHPCHYRIWLQLALAAGRCAAADRPVCPVWVCGRQPL